MTWIFKALWSITRQGIYAGRFQLAELGLSRVVVRGALRRLRALIADERIEPWDERWSLELELLAKIMEIRRDLDLSTKVISYLAQREGTFFPEVVWCRGAARMIEMENWYEARDYLDRARAIARNRAGRPLFEDYIAMLEGSLPAELQKPPRVFDPTSDSSS